MEWNPYISGVLTAIIYHLMAYHFLPKKIEELETICNSHSHHRAVHVAFTILFFKFFLT